jgi:hypothetical protein
MTRQPRCAAVAVSLAEAISSDHCLDSGMDQIAQELIDKFIDGLHDDVQTLQACSLVSKRWVYRSQHHIFSRITISSQQSFERWCKNIPLASCPVSVHTRTLSILQPTHAQWLTPLLLSPATGHFGAFNNVKTLALSGITTRGLQDAQLLADCFRRLGSSVTSLKLLYWRASPASLIDCICFFPHIDDLDVYRPDILAGLPTRKAYPSTPLFRGRLSLTFENGRGGIDRFLRLLSQLPARFREVHVNVNFIGGQTLVLPFLKSCSKSVQKLYISYEIEQGLHLSLFLWRFMLTVDSQPPPPLQESEVPKPPGIDNCPSQCEEREAGQFPHYSTPIYLLLLPHIRQVRSQRLRLSCEHARASRS